MLKTIRYGFIGCGMMGQEHLRNLFLIDGVDVTAIFEPDSIMRDECRRLVSDSNFVETEEDVIRSENVDALIITSPNYFHCDQLKKIVEIRQIPILIEKPVCTSLEQIKELKKINKNYSSPIWVAMEYRYMPVISKLLEIIRSQQILGKMISLNIREHRYPFLKKVGNWNRFNKKTGGTLVEKCCHFFDLMRLILKSEPVRLYASGAQDLNHLDEKYDGEVPDILDNAIVVVDFKSGQRAVLDLNMFADGSWFQESIIIVGTEGKIECEIPGPTRFWPNKLLGNSPTAKLTLCPRNPKDPKFLEVPVDNKLLDAGDHNGATFYQHQKFANVVRGKQSVEVSLDDGIKAVMIGLAAQHSIETRKAIDLTSGDYNLD